MQTSLTQVGLFGALLAPFKLFLELQLNAYPRAEILTLQSTIADDEDAPPKRRKSDDATPPSGHAAVDRLGPKSNIPSPTVCLKKALKRKQPDGGTAPPSIPLKRKERPESEAEPIVPSKKMNLRRKQTAVDADDAFSQAAGRKRTKIHPISTAEMSEQRERALAMESQDHFNVNEEVDSDILFGHQPVPAGVLLSAFRVLTGRSFRSPFYPSCNVPWVTTPEKCSVT